MSLKAKTVVHQHDHDHDGHDHGDAPDGAYGIDYFEGRKRNRQLVYRLRRRTDEVERAIRTYGKGRLEVVVDIGTADARMLDSLSARLGNLRCVGIDLSEALLRANPQSTSSKLLADAEAIPVKSGVADVAVATAVVEHVPHPEQLFQEAHRILRSGGLLTLSAPDPRWEKAASRLGILKDAGHLDVMDLDALVALARAGGFEVLEASKFMFSPVGFPAEKSIEKVLRALRLNAVMANQFLVARKVSQ